MEMDMGVFWIFQFFLKGSTGKKLQKFRKNPPPPEIIPEYASID